MDYTLQYYDLVLGGVLASLLAGLVVGWLTPFPLAATVPIFALVAAAIIGHGLFVNGPVDRAADLRDEVGALD
jgi:predicted CDP-diglyceride synthetase/phosphatidate cytidylyltransferase